MGLLSRMDTMVKAKVSKLLDRFEDPRETLDYSYERQLELLQDVKRGVVDVATSKKRLELQRAKLQQNLEKLDGQAREALENDREDLARVALERKVQIEGGVESLDAQIEDLEREQQKLESTEKRLAAKVEAFRTKKETIKAEYGAAEAQVEITEAVTGISEEMDSVGLAIERAEDKTEQMKARSAALDELVERGTLEESIGHESESERELRKMRSESRVEEELQKLREEVK